MMTCDRVGGETPVVLIADREPAMRTLLDKMIRMLGIVPEQAASAASCADRVQQCGAPLCALVYDAGLRDLPPEQVLDLFTRHHPHVPILLMSASLNEQIQRLLCRYNCALLQKPFMLEELNHTLQGAGVAAGPATQGPARG